MTAGLVLASSSRIRSALLSQAGIAHQVIPPRVDEDSAKLALLAEGASPRTIADTLAELKARKLAEKMPGHMVLGCDQTLSLQSRLFSKPASQDEAALQLQALQGQTHHLHAAIVLYENARPIWRHIGEARMTMRPLSDGFIAGYVAENWPDIAHSVGGYMIEQAGLRLFSAIDGEHTTILGLPVPPLVGYLALRGVLPT